MRRSWSRPLPAVAELFVVSYVPRAAVHECWARVYGMLSPSGVMHTTVTRIAASAFIVVHLVLAVAMWRTRRFLFWPRLALALADVLVCVPAADGDHVLFIVPAVALAVDAGMRWGWRSFVVPAAVMVPAVWLPEHARYALLTGAVPVVLACLFGMGFVLYGRLRDHAIDTRARLDVDARVTAAHAAGRSDVLLASEATADLVQRAGVLLDLGRAGPSTARSVAAMKAHAAEETRRLGAYLGDVLLAWQRAHNRGADLSRLVTLDIDAGVGTAMVTGVQARQVRADLDRLDLRGPVPVTSAGGSFTSLDGNRRLRVGDAVVDIPRAGGLASWVLSPMPVSGVMIALWMLSAYPAGQTTSLAVPAVFFVLGLVLAYRSHRLIAADSALVGRTLLEAWLLMAAYCVALWPFGVVLDGAGRAVPFAATGAIELLIVYGALAYPFLGRRARWWLVPGFLAMVVLDALPSTRAFGWRNFVAEIGFLPSMLVLIGDAGPRFEALATARRRSVEERGDVEVADGYAAGRAEALDGLRRSLAELRADLEERRPLLAADVAAEAERRVRVAEASLVKLA